MKTDQFGRIIFNESELITALYQGTLDSFDQIFIDDLKTSNQFNQAKKINYDSISDLNVCNKVDLTISEFDKLNQNVWFMPENYFPNLIEYLYSCCTTEEQKQRVDLELELFAKYNMFNLLKYLKYLVDTMRKNNIVWGVGRGSSVSSYVLYLLGVHRINSIKYNLDIHEFLK